MRCKRYNDNKGDTTDQNKTNGKKTKKHKSFAKQNNWGLVQG